MTERYGIGLTLVIAGVFMIVQHRALAEFQVRVQRQFFGAPTAYWLRLNRLSFLAVGAALVVFGVLAAAGIL